MFQEFISLVKSINKNNKIIFFCENKNLYNKVFKNKIINLHNKDLGIQVITFKSKIDEQINGVKYINFNNYDFLKVFFKLIKDKLIVSSTPTINKTISNETNYFVFLQHTLLRLTNKYTKEHIKHFDKITVSSKDQEDECCNLLKIDKSKLLSYKYHNLEFITNENNGNYNNNEKPIILMASSFYGNNLLKLIDENLIKYISKHYRIIFRPHPENFKDQKLLKKIEDFEIKFGKSIFEISNDTSNKEIIDKSNYLITDFSGIALTFSYRKLLPTIFIIKDQNDNILLHENYYKNTLKNIGIQINYSNEMIIDTINHIKKNYYNYNEKILNLKKLQFEKFKNVNSFENFISEKLSKII